MPEPAASSFEGALDLFGTIRYSIFVNAPGAALELTDEMNIVHLSSNAGGPVVITKGNMATGQRIVLTMTAFDTDAYTLSVAGGTLTLTSANAVAELYFDGTDCRVLSVNAP